MIEIDGSYGEGGGQILRSSLSLSICTQQAFRITNIRANRDKPGLLRQHLTAVKAAAEICGADITGAELRSRELTFKPRAVTPGSYSFAIGTAGSCTLVLQTVLPPLLLANSTSVVRVSGGTHNRGSPPFDFLQRAFIPVLRRMGGQLTVDLTRYGFYPRGGGEIVLYVNPTTALRPLHLHERGAARQPYAESYIAALPLKIAQRELDVIGRRLNWPSEQLLLRALSNDEGPGNAVTITLDYEHVTEVVTAFGERHVRAETVAAGAAEDALSYLAHAAPVGEHLADQLLVPFALAGGGSFTATASSEHLRSNARVVTMFTGKHVDVGPCERGILVSIR